jgi:hypothetical protein
MGQGEGRPGLTNMQAGDRYIKQLLAEREHRIVELETQRTQLVKDLADARAPRSRQIELLRWRLDQEMKKRIRAESKLHRIVGGPLVTLKDAVLRRFTTIKAADEESD